MYIKILLFFNVVLFRNPIYYVVGLNKEKYLEKINKYIRYYCQDLSFDEFKREVPGRDLSEREINIVRGIYEDLSKLCKKYVDKKITPKELESYASNMLYKEYNPNLLYLILSRDVYDFLIMLDEFTFYSEEDNSN